MNLYIVGLLLSTVGYVHAAPNYDDDEFTSLGKGVWGSYTEGDYAPPGYFACGVGFRVEGK
jgi:hypothetical protein